MTDPNIFVLIDEGHRSQYGEVGIKMGEDASEYLLHIAVTGTPLMKKEKNGPEVRRHHPAGLHGGSGRGPDKTVVPLLYEEGAWCLRWYTRRRLTAISTRFADG